MSENLHLKFTGNPFVDAGIFALMKMSNKSSLNEINKDDLVELSKEISNLYVKENWNSNMYSIFPNSVLVNPASAKKGDPEKLYLNILEEFIKSIPPVFGEGSCVSCGRRNAQETFGKSTIPLTGSGSLKNYFSFANDGADYCSLCALLIQFSPLIMYRSGGKFILLHSNSKKVMKFWTKHAIKNIREQILLEDYTGCFNEGFTNPTNAIFRIISKVISSNDLWEGENPSLNFYYFTNYNQGPELDIFTLPTNVFNFLTFIPQDELSNWNLIIRHSYRVKWDKVKTFEDYKNNFNHVYNALLSNRSILKFLYNFKYKKTYCSWTLVKYYIKEVRNMDEKRIESIKEVGSKLADYIQVNDDKKTLSGLEMASNYNSFRNVLRKVLKNKINNSDEELLFTFEDYVVNLFPEGNKTWRETQDLLLFRIYEKLHEWMVESKYVEEFKDESILEEE